MLLKLRPYVKDPQHNTTQHNTTQHNTTQHNTTQHLRLLVFACLFSLCFSSVATAQFVPFFGQPLTPSDEDRAKLDQNLCHYSTFTLSPLDLRAHLLYSNTDEYTVDLNVGNEILRLTLHKGIIAAPGAAVTMFDSSLNKEVGYSLDNEGIYRGYVNGDTLSPAAFIIREKYFSGYYFKSGQLWNVSRADEWADNSDFDPAITYAKYLFSKDPFSENLLNCPPIEDPEPPATDRSGKKYYLDIAYDVDGELYEKFIIRKPDGTIDDKATRKDVESHAMGVTNRVEGIYRALDVDIDVIMVVLHIWDNKNTDPYISNEIVTNWGECKAWWEVNQGCVGRDVVALLSGKPVDNFQGYVNPTMAFDAMCGSPLNYPGCADAAYLVSRQAKDTLDRDENKVKDGIQVGGRSVAHEIAHLFGANHDCTGCGLMYGYGCSSQCNNPGDGWDVGNVARVKRRFKNPPINVCRDNITVPGDVCLLGTSTNGAGISVQLTPDKVFCPGSTFKAEIFNSLFTSPPVTWTLGPYIQLVANQSINPLQRNLIVDPTLDCNTPINTWIRATVVQPGCTLEYIKEIQLNSVSLEGIFTQFGRQRSLQGTNIISSGAVTVALSKPGSYTWEEQLGANGPWIPISGVTSNVFSFNVNSAQTRIFRATTTSASCPSCNISFFMVFIVPPQGRSVNIPSGSISVYPNPTNAQITVAFDGELLVYQTPPLLRVLDVLGRIVLTAQANQGERNLTLDLNYLPTGSYYLQVNTADHNIVQKVVKN